MEISLLSRVVVINMERESDLAPAFVGRTQFGAPAVITLSKSGTIADVYHTLMHELCHAHLRFTGQDQAEHFNLEQVCDIAGAMIAQLVIENGAGVLQKLWRWCGKS